MAKSEPDKTTLALIEYGKIRGERQRAISINKSKVMRGKAGFIPVLNLPPRPKRRVAYEKDGTYVGTLYDWEEVKPEWVIKMENATW